MTADQSVPGQELTEQGDPNREVIARAIREHQLTTVPRDPDGHVCSSECLAAALAPALERALEDMAARLAASGGGAEALERAAWDEEDARLVAEALGAVDAYDADPNVKIGHWPTVAGWLAVEVRRLRAALGDR